MLRVGECGGGDESLTGSDKNKQKQKQPQVLRLALRSG